MPGRADYCTHSACSHFPVCSFQSFAHHHSCCSGLQHHHHHQHYHHSHHYHISCQHCSWLMPPHPSPASQPLAQLFLPQYMVEAAAAPSMNHPSTCQQASFTSTCTWQDQFHRVYHHHHSCHHHSNQWTSRLLPLCMLRRTGVLVHDLLIARCRLDVLPEWLTVNANVQ